MNWFAINKIISEFPHECSRQNILNCAFEAIVHEAYFTKKSPFQLTYVMRSMKTLHILQFTI